MIPKLAPVSPQLILCFIAGRFWGCQDHIDA